MAVAGPTIIQSGKNAVVYQVQPMQVVLPAATTAGSYLLVIVEGQKSGFPYDFADLDANTPAPTVSDDKSNVYSLVDFIKNMSQEPGDSPVTTEPDDAGFFPSLYAFLAPATTGTQVVSVSAFYSEGADSNSPPTFVVDGRAVYDGGLQIQVYEVANMASGATTHGTVEGISATLGAGLILPGGADELCIEVLALMNSSAFSSGIGLTSPPQIGPTIVDEGAFLGGASYWAVQTTGQTVAEPSDGFSNPLQYTGGVLALFLK